MDVFVTGGAGFIGKNLVASLLKDNHKVTIFDNFSNSVQDEITDLFNNKVAVIKGDITNPTEIFNSLLDSEIVVHLAAKIDVNESIQNPAHFNNVNVSGTVNLLEMCVKKNIKNIIVASSAAVYGNTSVVPLSEKYSPNPLSPYGASKLATEAYLKAFSNSFELNSVSLRFFNIYGVGQTNQYAGVITKFIQDIRKNSAIKIYGDGNQIRDFVSIHDVIESIHNAISKLKGKRGNAYNIGTGNPTSVNELIKIFEHILNKKLDVEFKEKQKGSIQTSYADISLAKKDLGFNPKISLKEGLREMLR